MFKKNKNKNQPNMFNGPRQGQGRPPQGRPGMPPQGMPPQGRPPQGGPGMPPQGRPGMPPQGRPPQGGPGMPPQGRPPQNQPKGKGLFKGKGNKKEKGGSGLFGGILGGKKNNKEKNPQQIPGQQQWQQQGPGRGMNPMQNPNNGPAPGGQMPPRNMGQNPNMGQNQNMGNQPFRGNQQQPPYMGGKNNSTIPNQIPNESGLNSQGQPEINNGMRNPQMNQNNRQYDVEREYYSKSESKDVYGGKEMLQDVFLYAPPTNFISIQKYINETYRGVRVMGTSSLANVVDEYKTKLNSSIILIFISNEEELGALVQFIEYLINIKSRNSELLGINIILGKNVKLNVIQGIKNNNLLNLMQLNSTLDRLSSNDIDEVMSVVVQKQPTYLDSQVTIEKIDVPKKARQKRRVDVNNLFRLKNIDELRNEVSLDKNKLDAEKLYNTLENHISSSKDVNDIDELVEMVPELSTLQEYSDSLNEYLEENKGRLSASEINEIVVSKLELSAYQKEAIETIFGTVIEYAENRAKREDEEVRESNRGMLAEMGSPDDGDMEKLLEQRAIIKERVVSGFNEYKRNVQFISNAIASRKYLSQKLQKELIPVVKDDIYNEVSEDTKEVTVMLLQNIESSKKALDENRTQIQNRLAKTFDYVKSLFSEFNVLITLDEIIIDKLIDDKQRAETSSINKVYNVDNELRARGKYINVIDYKEYNVLSKVVYEKVNLVITNMDEMQFSNKLVIKNADEFIEEDYTERTTNVVRLGNWERDNDLENKMDRLINKLKFISKYYTKVIFAFDSNVDEYIRNRVLDEISEVIIITSTNKEDLIKCNKFLRFTEEFDTIYGKTVAINNYESETSEFSINEIRTLAGIKSGIREVFLTCSKAFKDKEYLGKTVAKLRRL